ncbi:MAG: histidine kinase, partial [Prevotellaceae bacterium]|nr:histidine kinase [Prevotellaceae bacterium]
MKQLNSLASNKMILIISVTMGTLIIYPNIIDLLWHLPHKKNPDGNLEYIFFFIFRYIFFCILIWILLSINIRKTTTLLFSKRLLQTFLISTTAYAMYVCISLALCKHVDCFTGILLFQFVIVCLLCTLTGYVFAMYSEHKNKELEIEQLKTENLQSRYDALANQINPHFFFNSLNSIAALVREEKKEQTLEYIQKLSGVFRYILQSDKKGLVSLREELIFLEAFRYIFEIRYANKLEFYIDIDTKKQDLQIPVLSLLPLVENAVKHNVIDSDNHMKISIVLNNKNELIISNPIHEKIEVSGCNGIGLSNLSERFLLLTNNEVKVEKDNGIFKVILPLNSDA